MTNDRKSQRWVGLNGFVFFVRRLIVGGDSHGVTHMDLRNPSIQSA
jgi:hypothetical protein